MRAPSAKIDKMGTTIGCLISIGLIFIGIVQIFIGKSLWGIVTIAISSISLFSNRFHHERIKDKEI